jgi:hypothetical protein
MRDAHISANASISSNAGLTGYRDRIELGTFDEIRRRSFCPFCRLVLAAIADDVLEAMLISSPPGPEIVYSGMALGRERSEQDASNPAIADCWWPK